MVCSRAGTPFLGFAIESALDEIDLLSVFVAGNWQGWLAAVFLGARCDVDIDSYDLFAKISAFVSRREAGTVAQSSGANQALLVLIECCRFAPSLTGSREATAAFISDMYGRAPTVVKSGGGILDFITAVAMILEEAETLQKCSGDWATIFRDKLKLDSLMNLAGFGERGVRYRKVESLKPARRMLC